MPEIYASIILALRESRRVSCATRGGNLLLSGTVHVGHCRSLLIIVEGGVIGYFREP